MSDAPHRHIAGKWLGLGSEPKTFNEAQRSHGLDPLVSQKLHVHKVHQTMPLLHVHPSSRFFALHCPKHLLNEIHLFSLCNDQHCSHSVHSFGFAVFVTSKHVSLCPIALPKQCEIVWKAEEDKDQEPH